MSKDQISYMPTEGLCYDPAEPTYWDPEMLRMETERVFEVCHGCRMCFKFCDSFPKLFDLIDDSYDGDVRKLTGENVDDIVDDCFQCKLCEVQCPYTPRDNHEFQLDFPKLMHRHRAHRAKEKGLTFREKLLGNPDGLATVARMSFGLANVMNKVSLHRWFMEKIAGIHRDKLLPDFAGTTFERWAAGAGLIKDEPGGEVVIFQTCYVNNNEPEIGRDTVEVYQHNQIDVRCERGLNCCGMPAWEHGDLENVQAQAKRNLDLLEPHVDAGAKIVAINPTCSMMLRREYPELAAPEDRDRAKKVAEAIRDPSEYLWEIRKEERFNTDFKSTPGVPIAYHAPCHLRAQAVGFRGRDLFRKIPGVKPKAVMECCGHDGTYAMTTEGFEPSQRIGKKAFDGMKEVETEIWSTDCPLAAIQFEQFTNVTPMHPMTVLAKAYREDGFAAPKQLEDKKS